MYVLLSGESMWQRGDEEWQIRRPGDYIYHSPHQLHCMRSLDEPLLAMWAWAGEITTDADWAKKGAAAGGSGGAGAGLGKARL